MRYINYIIPLLYASGSYGWNWAKKGKASVTRYGSMGILSCNCKISAMEVGPACAINENAYGGYDSFGSGPACGMCYKLTPYGTSETTNWPATEADLPGPMVFKVTDICPHNANPAWCPSPDSEKLNSRGFEYHFDINVDSWQPETLIQWFGKGSLGTMNVDFELVSCEEWIGWDKKGQFEGTGENPYWGCCPANPGVLSQADTVCGSPASSNPPAPQESDRIKPADFPFVDDINGSQTTEQTTTTKVEQTSTGSATPSCWASPEYKCCTSSDPYIAYVDEHLWGVEDGEWCGVIIEEEEETSSATATCWSSPDYKCCKSCDIVYTDEDDKHWGVEDNEWCGIIDENCKMAYKNCPTKKNKCCKYCNVVTQTGNTKYGVENNSLCIIKNNCSDVFDIGI